MIDAQDATLQELPEDLDVVWDILTLTDKPASWSRAATIARLRG